jgi:hypothetical protein
MRTWIMSEFNKIMSLRGGHLTDEAIRIILKEYCFMQKFRLPRESYRLTRYDNAF